MFHLNRPEMRSALPSPGPRRRTRRLLHEPLEPRVVLSTNPLGAGIDLDAPNDASETAPVSAALAATDTTSQDALNRFASAEELKQYLIEDALDRWGYLFGTKNDYLFICGDLESTSRFAYSNTNVQVAGVDEPDVVETDGRYLYSLSRHELIVREIGDDAQPTVVARLALGNDLRGMLLAGNRLTVLAQKNKMVDPNEVYVPQTEVIVFDVSDPANASIVERTFVDGSYTDARAIGDKVYLVSHSDFFLPKPRVLGGSTAGEYEPGTYETQEEYLARIEDQVLDLVLPTLTSFGGDGELANSGWLVEPTEIYRPQSDEQTQLNNVVVFEIGDQQLGPLDAIVVAADSATEIHLSEDGLYILGTELPQWSRLTWWPLGQTGNGQDTSILKFSVDDQSGELALAAAGNVSGRLLDQFSFDTHEGYLRIATTAGNGTEATNNLYVLQQNGESLEIVGQIEGIAPGEQIYSARFLGDQAYVVTFRTVDPLYAVDLSDPADPQIVGELKIPGFSNYMQDIGGGFLLGLGRDASTGTGLYADPQVSLFDVSDLSDPQLAARYTLPVGRTGGLNLFYDHHSVAYFPEHGILTIVAPASEESSGEGLWAFRIDTSTEAIDAGTAIEHLTTIQHADSFWTRAVRMGDKLVVSSASQVTVHDLPTPGEILGIDEARSLGISDSRFYTTTMPSLADGDYLFTLEAQNTGFLTFDALFERTELSDATLTLYDWQMNELAVSESDYPWAQARLDWQAEAGQRFFLKVSGTATDVELRVLNVVNTEGENSDSILRINSPTWDGDIGFEFYWHGDSGRPWKNEPAFTVMSRRLSLDIAGVHYDIAMNTPNVIIEGSGQNALTVDVTNITMSGSDHGDIVADLGDGSGTITISGPVFGTTGDGEEIGFEMTILDFLEITVNGGDVAKLRGSEGDDTFTATPGMATMVTPGNLIPADDPRTRGLNKASRTGLGSFVRVNDFREVHAYSGSGQRDTAKLYDTPTNDKLVATPDYTKIRGKDYFARAKGFRFVHGYAKTGGDDTAILKDSSGDDLCIAKSPFVRMKGTGYSNRAKFFENVEVRAHANSGDKAILRDAVLTSETDLGDLQAAVLFRGMEHFKMRGNSTDERSETETVDRFMAYWPE